MTNKIKHLEFIQAIISRMNSNSFLLKGWCIGIVSAVFALAAKDANVKFCLISYFAILMFWLIDGYYLSQERKYRALYDHVASLVGDDTDFSLDSSGCKNGNVDWPSSLLSSTLLLFYGVMAILALAVMFLSR